MSVRLQSHHLKTTSKTKRSPKAEVRFSPWRGLIDEALNRILTPDNGAPSILYEAMRYCVLSGGKRFRPLLCLAACEASGSAARKALPVACAVELIHTYSLVHDDLPAMDNADMRRGNPSCHRRYGEANAILVGDALLTLSLEILSRNGIPNSLAIIQTITRAAGTTGLIGGQVLDLQRLSQSRGKMVESLTETAQKKTAALIIASVVSGALAGGASSPQLARLRKFAQNTGLAFQLIDDVHDAEGLAQAMGVDEARLLADQLIDRAVKILKPFGSRAKNLQFLAEWLAST